MKWFPALLDNQDDSISWVNQHALTAYNKGFSSERDLLMYMNVIGFLGEGEFLNLEVYLIKEDPDIKNMMIRQIHASKKDAIYKVMEPEVELPDNIELRLQQLAEKLPQVPESPVIQPKPVPIAEDETEEEAKENKQREVPLFD